MNTEIWRQRLAWWLPPLALFVLAAAALIYYHAAGIGRRVSLLEERIERLEVREKALAAEAARVSQLEAQAQESRGRIALLYQDRLATESDRLTAITAEVRRLAQRAGLEPTAMSYPQQSLAEFGLVGHGFVFTVSGDYQGLREFINALELTETFIVLDDVGLSEETGAGGGQLRINLRLSTLFIAEDETTDDGGAALEGAGT